jgi:hypothetical protein
MAERVFPNNLNVDMGSKIQFSGIDWENVENNIRNPRLASDSDDVIDLLKKLTGASEEQIDEAIDELKADDDQEAPPQHDSVQEDSEDSEADKDEDVHSDSSMKSSSSNTLRKIAFTHPSQISAQAIEIAEAAGDLKLKNTILAARKLNRTRIASAIQSNLKKEAELLKRKANRELIVKLAQNVDDQARTSIEDAISNNKEINQSLVDAYNTSVKSNMGSLNQLSEGFMGATAFSKAQRKAFANAALAQGMPVEYVNSICPPIISNEVTKLANSASEIVKSNISLDTKKVAVASLVKEAKLSQESKSEFIDYWNNVLGYQDKDFWPMVAKDYTDEKVSK